MPRITSDSKTPICATTSNHDHVYGTSTDDLGEKTLRPATRFCVLFGLLLVIMAGLPAGMAVQNPAHRSAWVVATAAAVVVFALPLVFLSRTYLRLDADGFETREGLGATRVAWNEVASPFEVTTFLRGNSEQRVVVFDFVPGYTRYPKTRAWAKRWLSREGAVSAVYGCSADELADRMNLWRARGTARQPETARYDGAAARG